MAVEVAFLGLTLEDYGAEINGPDVEVWPDCWQSVSIFSDLATQWRTGPSGAVGLDYAAIPAVLSLSRIPSSEWHDLFRDIRVLEAAALEELHKG